MAISGSWSMALSVAECQPEASVFVVPSKMPVCTGFHHRYLHLVAAVGGRLTTTLSASFVRSGHHPSREINFIPRLDLVGWADERAALVEVVFIDDLALQGLAERFLLVVLNFAAGDVELASAAT
jgi:hypothetical protein